MPPPLRTVGTGSPQEWHDLEAESGLYLPSDYKEFLAVYGAGSVDDRFSIPSPFFLEAFQGSLRESDRRFSQYTRDFLPDARLVPWGYNFERGDAYWEADSPDPEDWTVCTDFDDDVYRFPEGMLAFLTRTILNEHQSDVLYNRASPFVAPVEYYPDYDPVRFYAVFGPTDVPREVRNEFVRRLFPGFVAKGPDVNFETFWGLQGRVPRLGWSIRYGSDPELSSRSEPGTKHDLRVAVSKEEGPSTRIAIGELAAKLGAEILSIAEKEGFDREGLGW